MKIFEKNVQQPGALLIAARKSYPVRDLPDVFSHKEFMKYLQDATYDIVSQIVSQLIAHDIEKLAYDVMVEPIHTMPGAIYEDYQEDDDGIYHGVGAVIGHREFSVGLYVQLLGAARDAAGR